jgi:AraC family transcriptional regulator
LKEITSASRLSVWHAARMLKHETGFPFSSHLHKSRVLEATDLLHDATLSVKEIAALVGYGSSSQFGRHFRRLTGTTPRAFRARACAEMRAHAENRRVIAKSDEQSLLPRPA